MSSTLRKLSWVLNGAFKLRPCRSIICNLEGIICRLDIVGYPSPSMHIIFNGEQVLEACLSNLSVLFSLQS